jgi:UDP-glucose 4-epimerase
MNILVTGGAGFIGSHLTERLLAQGHRVRVLDNLSTGKLENLPEHSALTFIKGDICDAVLVDECMDGVEVVYHLAAVASVQASVDDPLGTHRSNLVGTVNLLEAARQQRISRFFYASSAAVYGDTTDLPIREDIPLNPLTPYAIDKLSGEYYLKYYAKQAGFAGIAFRFFNIYGPRQDPSSPYSGVISIFTDRAVAQKPITVFGDGGQSRDFVFVKDLVGILTQGLEVPLEAIAVVNIGGGASVTLLDLLEALETILARPLDRRYDAPRAGDIRHSLADTSRLQALFGRVPATPLTTGLEQILNFERDLVTLSPDRQGS